jgi:hypothetical protein
VPIYLVDRDLPGMSLQQIAEARQRAEEATRRLTAAGTPVRYLRSTFVPAHGHMMCLFEAPSAACVLEVNDLAQFPLLRVIEAVEFQPPRPQGE